MTLAELLRQRPYRPAEGVPDWMLGCFQRSRISFFNGESDSSTLVFWFQSRNFIIDLRLPVALEQVSPRKQEHCSEQELRTLAQYEGWEAQCRWEDNRMSWFGETSLQVHNRWPEPASLHRVGNCMIEFAPSGAYVEDWRLQPTEPGPLVGLRLIEERDGTTGEVLHRGGGLIICGAHAAMVVGRADDALDSSDATLPERVEAAQGDVQQLGKLFDFETSVAQGSVDRGFTIHHSTRPERMGEALTGMDQFEWLDETQQVRQTLTVDGQTRERLFAVDVLEPEFDFSLATETTASARAWFEREAATLTRYTGVLD